MGKGEYQAPGGDTPGMNAGMGAVWGLTIASAFVRALFLNVIVVALGGTTLVAGATTGFLLWLGLIATTTLTNKLFADHVKSWYYEAGDHLLNFVIIGAIVGLWH